MLSRIILASAALLAVASTAQAQDRMAPTLNCFPEPTIRAAA